MHKPQALDRLVGVGGEAQFHNIGEAKAENIGKQLNGGVKVGCRQYGVAHTDFSGDKFTHTDWRYESFKV